VAAEARAKGHALRAALSRGWGISRKIKNRSVYGHLNALQLSISVHQRCSVTFKMHQIHLRSGLGPTRTLGSTPTLSSRGWNLGQRGAAGRMFALGATDPRATTDGHGGRLPRYYRGNGDNYNSVISSQFQFRVSNRYYKIIRRKRSISLNIAHSKCQFRPHYIASLSFYRATLCVARS